MCQQPPVHITSARHKGHTHHTHTTPHTRLKLEGVAAASRTHHKCGTQRTHTPHTRQHGTHRHPAQRTGHARLLLDLPQGRPTLADDGTHLATRDRQLIETNEKGAKDCQPGHPSTEPRSGGRGTLAVTSGCAETTETSSRIASSAASISASSPVSSRTPSSMLMSQPVSACRFQKGK